VGPQRDCGGQQGKEKEATGREKEETRPLWYARRDKKRSGIAVFRVQEHDANDNLL